MKNSILGSFDLAILAYFPVSFDQYAPFTFSNKIHNGLNNNAERQMTLAETVEQHRYGLRGTAPSVLYRLSQT